MTNDDKWWSYWCAWCGLVERGFRDKETADWMFKTHMLMCWALRSGVPNSV